MRGDPSGIARGARSRCLVRPFLPGRLTLHAVGSTTPVRLSTAFDAWGPRAGSALRTAGAGVLGVGDVSGLVWTTTPAGGFLTGHGYLTNRRTGRVRRSRQGAAQTLHGPDDGRLPCQTRDQRARRGTGRGSSRRRRRVCPGPATTGTAWDGWAGVWVTDTTGAAGRRREDGTGGPGWQVCGRPRW